jgi:metallopeptidase MepB
MRIDVYKAKVTAQDNLKKSGQWDELSAEEQRLVDKMVKMLLCWR